MASTIAEAAEKAFEQFSTKADDTPEDGIVEAPEGDAQVADEYLEDPDPLGQPEEPQADSEDAPDGSSDADGSSIPDNRIEVTEETVIVLPDGSEVKVNEAALRQADYTRKTQQLAEERKILEKKVAETDQVLSDFETWYQERSANPDNWIAEIAKSLPDRGVRTQMIARALKQLAASGYLEDDFVQTFGLVAGKAAEFAEEPEADRIAQLEAQLQAQKAEKEIETRVRQQAAILQAQWDDIKSSYGVTFATPQEEVAAKKEALQFAKANGVANLRVAYDAMQARRPSAATPSRQPDAATTDKKRASRAITQKSQTAGQVSNPQKKAATIRQAAELALDRYIGAA